MPQKLRDIAVKTGEYMDRQSGQTKGRWQNVGALMKGDDGNEFIILHRWFNPAGVPNPDNRDSVLMSCFRPDRQQGGQQAPPQHQGQYGAPPAQGAPQGQQAPPQGHPGPGAPAGSDFDDEIPFAALHNIYGG